MEPGRKQVQDRWQPESGLSCLGPCSAYSGWDDLERTFSVLRHCLDVQMVLALVCPHPLSWPPNTEYERWG
jgi:hypothetical protein